MTGLLTSFNRLKSNKDWGPIQVGCWSRVQSPRSRLLIVGFPKRMKIFQIFVATEYTRGQNKQG